MHGFSTEIHGRHDRKVCRLREEFSHDEAIQHYAWEVAMADNPARRKTDAVNHPPHYQSKAGIEVIDVIEAFNLGFNLGNTVKYVLRAGSKGERLKDLRKGMWYLQREIDNMQRDGK
jgi:hypothetical protein